MDRYHSERTPYGVNIHNLSPHYTLEVEFNREAGRPFLDTHFLFDIRGIRRMLVYERDAQAYLDTFENLPINPRFQYAEPGAGLGGFIPFLVREFGQRLTSRPIVIDPVDYALMADMLRYAKELQLGTDINERFNELISRAEIIMDPGKVYLVNMKLGEALRRLPKLKGIADVVIDYQGPANYPETEVSSDLGAGTNIENLVLEMERILLKPSGQHIFKRHS